MEDKKKYDESLLSRDYDVSEIREDPRLTRCYKEFWIVFITTFIGCVLPSLVIYGPNWGDVTEYSYILGYPAWFSLACASIFVVIAAIVYIAKKVLRDTELGDVDPSKDNL